MSSWPLLGTMSLTLAMAGFRRVAHA